MKKNLLTILILAFCIVNVIMNGFLLLSVMSTNNKTAALISDIAAAFELERAGGTGGGIDPATVNQNVALADIQYYSVNGGEAMTAILATVPTAEGGDGKTHYAQVTLELLMDGSNEDYETYSGMLTSMDNTIQNIVLNVVGQYNVDNVMSSQEAIKTEILRQLWAQFEDSTFIYNMNLKIIPA